jgi:hypothetical protein
MSEEQNIPSQKSEAEKATSDVVNEPISPSGKTESTNFLSTGPQSQTTAMEANNHSKPLPKKIFWSKAIVEFFMMFLAVFLGFIAENTRENISDKHKEKGYMISMLEDLKKDTLLIDSTLIENNILIKGNDSIIISLLGNLTDRHSAELALIMYLKYGLYYSGVTFTDRTISQLKNSGGMSLIKNDLVAKKIISYDNGKIYIQAGYDLMEKLQLENNTTQANHIFNIATNKLLYDSVVKGTLYWIKPIQEFEKLLTHGDPVLLTTDLKVISPFVSNIEYFISLMADYNYSITFQKSVAIELIKLIQKEYKLQ